MDKRRKRLFHRIVSGVYYHRHDPLRFITLSTDQDQHTDTNYAFRQMVQHIRRAGFLFEYLAVFTHERDGVIHLIQTGDYVDYVWLRVMWRDYCGSSRTDIKSINRRRYAEYRKRGLDANLRTLTNYIINQYLVDQDGLRHVQFSSGWLPEGATQTWKAIKKAHCAYVGQPDDPNYMWRWGYDQRAAIEAWRQYLDNYPPP